MTIGIVTDSSSDLPADVARRHGIGIVPLTIRFGDEALVDGADLDSSTFWQLLERSPQLPETAAPSPGAFLDAFGRLGDVDGVVCLCLSSRLSATYQAAVLAAEESELRVKVIDSGVVSMALGLVAINAAEVARTGTGLEAVAVAAAQAAARSNVFAALDTLEYLDRGGRVGRVSALLGGLLDIKPLITLEHGTVAAAGRVRTRAKAIAAVVDHVAGKKIAEIAIVHSGASDVSRLIGALGTVVDDPIVAELGPVVGTHTGPGVLGVAYLEA